MGGVGIVCSTQQEETRRVPQRRVVPDLHLKKMTLATPRRKVCKGQQQKEGSVPSELYYSVCNRNHLMAGGRCGGGEQGEIYQQLQ